MFSVLQSELLASESKVATRRGRLGILSRIKSLVGKGFMKLGKS